MTANPWTAPAARCGTLLQPFGDTVRITDEPPGEGEDCTRSAGAWVILIADDDRGVHDATVLALAGERLLGRPIELRHAYDAAAARLILDENRDIAAVLLDVVMETPDAGLELAAALRAEAGREDLKIILRTGQPGQAPEARVREDLAIDGYVTKAHLTRAALLEILAHALGGGSVPGEIARG